MAIPAKIQTRITAQLKRYGPILEQAKKRDIGESDTCIIITDMLADVLGYNKYEHITTEQAVKTTAVDAAVAVDGKLRFFIEAKAIGVELKDQHVRQAVDYCSNEGVEWIILSNAITWRLYRIIFGQPIEKVLISEFDALGFTAKDDETIATLASLSLECFTKEDIADFARDREMTSKYAIAAMLTSDAMLDNLRRELRRLCPGLRVDCDYLSRTLSNEVIKRDLIDGDESEAAQTTLRKLLRSQKRRQSGKAASEEAEPDAPPAPPTPTPTP